MGERFPADPAQWLRSRAWSRRRSHGGRRTRSYKENGNVNQIQNGIRDVTPAPSAPDPRTSDPFAQLHEPAGKPSGGGEVLDFRSAGADIRGSSAAGGKGEKFRMDWVQPGTLWRLAFWSARCSAATRRSVTERTGRKHDSGLPCPG